MRPPNGTALSLTHKEVGRFELVTRLGTAEQAGSPTA